MFDFDQILEATSNKSDNAETMASEPQLAREYESALAQRVEAAYPFEVEKRQWNDTPIYGLFRDDTNEFVGRASVTDRYEPHTTDDVCSLVEAASTAFGDDCDLQCRWSNRNGHSVFIAPSKEYRREVAGRSSDTIHPRLNISAGFGGKPYAGSLGLFRDLCANLAMMEAVKQFAFSFRHTASLRTRIPELVKQFETLKESWQTMGNLVDTMARTEIDFNELYNLVFPASENPTDTVARKERQRSTDIVRRLQSERIQLGQPVASPSVTAWEGLNAIQGYLQHDKTRKGSVDNWTRIEKANSDPAYETALEYVLETISA